MTDRTNTLTIVALVLLGSNTKMVSNSLNRHSHSTYLLFSHLNIFLVVSWYDFKNTNFQQSILPKLQACCLLILRTTLIIYLIINKTVQDFFTFIIPTQKIIYFFTNTTLLALTVTTVTKSGLLSVKNWSILIQKCQYIDTKTPENKSQLIYFKFLLKTVVFVVFLAYELYVCSISHNMSYFKIFILTPSIDM